MIESVKLKISALVKKRKIARKQGRDSKARRISRSIKKYQNIMIQSDSEKSDNITQPEDLPIDSKA